MNMLHRISLYRRLWLIPRARMSSSSSFFHDKSCGTLPHPKSQARPATSTIIPAYLVDTYWWAYLHPKGVQLFERDWIVNAILWGNYNLLATEMLREINPDKTTLQIACAYGNVTTRLALGMRAPLDVVDVAPIQIENLRTKLEAAGALDKEVGLMLSDATKLTNISNASREQVVMFFLLHELPKQARREALAEAWRVLADGGKLIIIDYHRPTRWSFHRYFMPFVFHTLEPFAMDLWKSQITDWLPKATGYSMRKDVFFQGLYQKVVITKASSSLLCSTH
ncbi:hypothetical protein MPSEU_000719800 [Mayamaea pseudoterrestris]|nr:hypothetical protein MPSEU_000719800 [Mayamaea pseudoterrestris]